MRVSHAYYDYPPARPCECSPTIATCHHCKEWKRTHPFTDSDEAVGSPLHPPARQREQAPLKKSSRTNDRSTACLWAREDLLMARLRDALLVRNALPHTDRRAIGAQEQVRSIRQMLRCVRVAAAYVPRPEILAQFEEPTSADRPLPTACPRGHLLTEGTYKILRMVRNTNKGRTVRLSRQCLACKHEKKEQYVNA